VFLFIPSGAFIVKYPVHTLLLTALLVGAPVFASAAPAAAAQAAQASDADLAAKVKAQIDADAEFKDLGVDVTAASGVVTLRGEVPSALVRAKIGELTKATEGVSKVNNRLSLKKQ
jgi:osmotically-inducible protein OsmY